MIKTVVLAIIAAGFPYVYACSQTCTGSLGDPIINETFGAGTRTLPSNKTTFKYMGGCPAKGFYTLDDFLFGCGGRTWAQMIGDHTRDTRGNYMLVNAENEAGVIYMDTAIGLCGNTLYQFGLWATGVMTKFSCDGNPVLPNIKYKITDLAGTVLAMDSTGKIPIVVEKEWKFYGLSFRTPAGIATDAIVSLTIDPPFGCGSGFAIDDITLRPCGPAVSASIDGNTNPVEICAGYTNPMIMTGAYSAGFSDPVIQWQSSLDTGKTWTDIPGETRLTYPMPRRNSGVVLYRMSLAERTNINSAKCRVTSNAISTTIHPVPEHKPPQSVFGCLNKDYFFPPTDPYALQVLWRGPNGYTSTAIKGVIPAIQYNDEGLYTLRQSLPYGCVSLDTFNLRVYPSTTISVQPSYPVCEGQSQQLLAMASDNNASYQWTPATGLSNPSVPNPVASPTDSTNYKVVVTNQYGCKDSATLQIDVYRNPAVNAGPDKTILLGDTAILNGLVKGTNVNYYWSPSGFLNNDRVVIPQAYPSESKTYTLHVESTVGCGSVSDVVNVTVYSSFAIPNAFTPNGDGKNDRFQILALDNYKLIHLYIYDRAGRMVFKAEGAYNGWDGKYKGMPQASGVYVYHLEMQAPSRGKIRKKGTLLLIR
jgi:gliding motility-associated-like protein